MKKTIKLLTVIMLILRMLVLTACTEFTEGEKRASTLIKYRDRLRYALEIYTGTCITYEELAQLVYSYEKVQEKWSGEEIVDGVFVPELQLVPPGKYERTEDTRYKITMLDKMKMVLLKVSKSVSWMILRPARCLTTANRLLLKTIPEAAQNRPPL